MGSDPGFLLVDVLIVGVVVGSELGDVGFGFKSISGSGIGQGFGSRQGAMIGSFSETGPGLGLTFLHILRGGFGEECLSTTMLDSLSGALQEGEEEVFLS